MGIDQKILVSGTSLRVGVAFALSAAAVLSACGQKGNLYLPSDPEFQQRATLPDILRRQLPGNTATPAATPASGATPAARPAAPSPATAASAAVGR